jgi:hypothetical protein
MNLEEIVLEVLIGLMCVIRVKDFHERGNGH